LLQQDGWRVKRYKCSFARREISYLGFVISSKGVSTNPDKIQSVASWPIPANAKELRSFLGLAGYYRKFVHHFGVISKPLTELLKKNVLFIWTSDHDKAFNILKSALVSAPVMAVPNFSKTFYIETDASDCGVGAVLMQEHHPLAFDSKVLEPRMRGLSTYEE
jgi:hypothetical protein